jgi:hypothetical protein
MSQEYTFDMDKLRESITQNIINIFDTIDEQMTPAEDKFMEFRSITEGYSLSHDALLRLLAEIPSEYTTIPIIEQLEEIYEGWYEETFNIERAWDEVRLLIKRMTIYGYVE